MPPLKNDSASSLPGESPADSIESIRNEFRTWLAAKWNPELTLVEWRRQLLASGWAVPSWPKQLHGAGLPAFAEDLVSNEIEKVGAVGPPSGVGMSLAAPTIMEVGSDRMRERFLSPILTGEETWCQLFSEPGAGSDLASVSATAVLDGDSWIVNGQKVWNTSAHHADFGMLLARTNWDVPKHRGLTYFALPMRQQGVEVRPLRQMNYHSSFMEVFLTDAVVPKEFVVGNVGEGWNAAKVTLAHERRFGGRKRSKLVGPGRVREEARIETEEYYETYKWYPQRAGRVDLLVEHARQSGRLSDPLVRQEIIRTISLQRVGKWTAQRSSAARALGRTPGPEGSIGKLATSNLARQASRTHSLIGGASGLLSAGDSPLDGMLAEILISVPAQSIAGGTDEIQRNIIGERALGLPREPSGQRDSPFSEVRRNDS